MQKPEGKGKHGGRRAGAGRKPKVHEQEIITRLTPHDDLAFKQLKMAMLNGESWALKLFFAYRFGMPKVTADITSNGETINIPPIAWVETVKESE